MTIFKTLGQERSHTPEWSSVFSPSSPTKKFENYHHKTRVGDIKVRLQLFLLFFGSLPSAFQKCKFCEAEKIYVFYKNLVYTEAVVWRCSVKKLFSEILQNSQENRYLFSCEFRVI